MAELDADLAKRQGTRVFKKSGPNGKITAYLSKRDFVDHLTHVDPIEGVVLLDDQYIKNRKAFVHVLAAFRYGREDLDVLGLSFRKDLFLASAQLYPPPQTSFGDLPTNPVPIIAVASCGGPNKKKSVIGLDEDDGEDRQPVTEKTAGRPLSRLQERLIKKLGPNAYPFYFELPPATPASVTLQPGPSDSGKPCGVDYELRAYIAEDCDEKPQSRSSVRMAIRKLTYAPEESAPQPSAEVVKDFIMSPGSLRLEVSLDKEKYYHGEYIAVNVLVDNNSNKTVKKVKVSVIQVADIMLFSRAVYKCTVDEAEYEEGCPIQPSQTGWCKVYHMCPLLSNNREKRGLALDGKLKNEDTNLASSTIIRDATQKENLGMIVQYRIRVRLVLGFGASDVSVDLPFTLTHPKPPAEEGDGLESFPITAITTAAEVDASGSKENVDGPPPSRKLEGAGDGLDECLSHPVDQAPMAAGMDVALQSNPNLNPAGGAVVAPDFLNDDLIFEDFARLRLLGQDSVTTPGPTSNPLEDSPRHSPLNGVTLDHPKTA